MTQDIMDWHFGKVLHAVATEKPAPSAVLQAHEARFESFFDAQPQSCVTFPVTVDPQQLEAVDCDEQIVQQVQQKLRTGAISIDDPHFSMNAAGQVVSWDKEPAQLLEAARQEGKVIPTQAEIGRA